MLPRVVFRVQELLHPCVFHLPAQKVTEKAAYRIQTCMSLAWDVLTCGNFDATRPPKALASVEQSCEVSSTWPGPQW